MTKKRMFLTLTATLLLLSMLLCSCDAFDIIMENNESPSDGNTNSNTNGDTNGSTMITETDNDEPFITRPIFENFILFDGNGDGVKDHVIKHDTMGISGGAGSYDLYVYEKANDHSYKRIFVSETYLEAHKNMGLTVEQGSTKNTIVFKHSDFDYSGEYVIDDNTYEFMYTTDPNTGKEIIYFTVDTFYSVEPADTDGDDCEELIMKQYVSVGWHANYVGDCVTVWKVKDGALQLTDLKMDFFYKTKK